MPPSLDIHIRWMFFLFANLIDTIQNHKMSELRMRRKKKAKNMYPGTIEVEASEPNANTRGSSNLTPGKYEGNHAGWGFSQLLV